MANKLADICTAGGPTRCTVLLADPDNMDNPQYGILEQQASCAPAVTRVLGCADGSILDTPGFVGNK